jgi:hypothetical protein
MTQPGRLHDGCSAQPAKVSTYVLRRQNYATSCLADTSQKAMESFDFMHVVIVAEMTPVMVRSGKFCFFVSSYCIRPLCDHGIYTQPKSSSPGLKVPADETSHFPRSSAWSQNKQKQKQKKSKTGRKSSFPLIQLSKKKRVAVAFAASSSPFLLADVPSAWCSQRRRL